jgi:hypothetical protein
MAQREDPIDIREFLPPPPDGRAFDRLPPFAQAQASGVARVATKLYEMVTAETDAKLAHPEERVEALELLCFGSSHGR